MKGTDFEPRMSKAGWRSVNRCTNTLLVTTFYGQRIVCCSALLLRQLVCASFCTINLYDEQF